MKGPVEWGALSFSSISFRVTPLQAGGMTWEPSGSSSAKARAEGQWQLKGTRPSLLVSLIPCRLCLHCFPSASQMGRLHSDPLITVDPDTVTFFLMRAVALPAPDPSWNHLPASPHNFARFFQWITRPLRPRVYGPCLHLLSEWKRNFWGQQLSRCLLPALPSQCQSYFLWLMII